MKTQTNYKSAFVKTITVATIVLSFVYACTDNKDTKAIAEEHNEATFENKDTKQDSLFLVKVAGINLEEIELGKLAQQNSKMKCVKDLGAMMEKQHSKAMNELKDLALKRAIIIPTSITQSGKDAYDKLYPLKGKDFDKEYCNMMVKGHTDAIAMFEKTSMQSNDDSIKSFAAAMLPVLRIHLDHAITCQEKCKM